MELVPTSILVDVSSDLCRPTIGTGKHPSWGGAQLFHPIYSSIPAEKPFIHTGSSPYRQKIETLSDSWANGLDMAACLRNDVRR